MRKVKTILMTITLLIGIGISQVVNAQQQEQLPINLVGKWINKNNDKQIWEFFADSTCVYNNGNGFLNTIEGTDITFPIKTYIYHYTWEIHRTHLRQDQVPNIEYILGDISYYPADIQKRIKEYMESWRDNETKKITTYRREIVSFSPEEITYQDDSETYTFVRDVSNMSAQQRKEFDMEVKKWNQIKKEKEQKEYLAALERDNLKMAKLKAKAVASGNANIYYGVGKCYENGIANDWSKITICLDSALVWYKKAAAIDPSYEEDVKAISYKIKTGRSYYEDKKKSEIEAEKKQIAQVRATYTKKYGTVHSNNLSKKGIITPGMSVAFIREFVNDYNRIGFYCVTNKLHLTFQEYRPTTKDILQYGKAVKSYRLILGKLDLYWVRALNGKVVSVTTIKNFPSWAHMSEKNLKNIQFR